MDGLIALMNSNYSMPMNLGNPDEYTIEQFATIIKDLIGMFDILQLFRLLYRQSILSRVR